MKVIQNLVPASKYNIKCPYPMVAEFIAVHNTANDASARNAEDILAEYPALTDEEKAEILNTVQNV